MTACPANVAFGISLEEASIAMGSLATLVAGGIVAYKKVVRPILRHFHDRSQKVQEREAVIQGMVQKVNTIATDLQPNSGSSLRDVINGLKCSIEAIDYKLVLMGKVNEAMTQDGPAYFRCTPQGENTEVNRTYYRMLKCGKQELLGNGWRNFMAPMTSREEYDQEWKPAFQEGREVSFTINFLDTDGATVAADVHAYPIPGSDGQVIEYLGFVRPKK